MVLTSCGEPNHLSVLVSDQILKLGSDCRIFNLQPLIYFLLESTERTFIWFLSETKRGFQNDNN